MMRIDARPAASRAHHVELDRCRRGVGGPHGVAVDGGVVERGDGLVRVDG
jgi:hypothetical protein